MDLILNGQSLTSGSGGSGKFGFYDFSSITKDSWLEGYSLFATKEITNAHEVQFKNSYSGDYRVWFEGNVDGIPYNGPILLKHAGSSNFALAIFPVIYGVIRSSGSDRYLYISGQSYYSSSTLSGYQLLCSGTCYIGFK